MDCRNNEALLNYSLYLIINYTCCSALFDLSQTLHNFGRISINRLTWQCRRAGRKLIKVLNFLVNENKESEFMPILFIELVFSPTHCNVASEEV